MTVRGLTSGWLVKGVRAAGLGLGQLLWPATCLNCRQEPVETGGDLCGRCWEELISVCGAGYCRRCGRDASPYAISDGVCPNCLGEEILFDGIARAGIYAAALREMVLAFKHDQTELDSILGSLADSALKASAFFDEIEMLVPVPLHWRTRLRRGYNQSCLVARKIRHPQARVSADLARIRNTEAQPTMPTPAARARNVAGAFAVRHRHGFAGRTVCLVDDIKTTGATLNECAKTLKEAGTSRVFALVLAVAGQDKR